MKDFNLRIVKKQWLKIANDNKKVQSELDLEFEILLDFTTTVVTGYSGAFTNDSGKITYIPQEFFLDRARKDVFIRTLDARETIKEIWLEFCQSVADNPHRVNVQHIIFHAQKYLKDVIVQMETIYEDEILDGKLIVIQFAISSFNICE